MYHYVIDMWLQIFSCGLFSCKHKFNSLQQWELSSSILDLQIGFLEIFLWTLLRHVLRFAIKFLGTFLIFPCNIIGYPPHITFNQLNKPIQLYNNFNFFLISFIETSPVTKAENHKSIEKHKIIRGKCSPNECMFLWAELGWLKVNN